VSEISDIYHEHLEAWSDIQGHLEFMHDVVIETNAGNVVELGVRSGVSTAAFLAGFEDRPYSPLGRVRSHLWSIDINPPPRIPAFYRSRMWTFVQGDDLVVRDCVPEDIDLLFIDTLHHYEHTLAELRLYGPTARFILLHDTDLEHPHGAPRGDPPFPVRTAIETWVAEQPVFHGIQYREGSYGMAVIM
jgi:cephalosporin hydroxylase